MVVGATCLALGILLGRLGVSPPDNGSSDAVPAVAAADPAGIERATEDRQGPGEPDAAGLPSTFAGAAGQGTQATPPASAPSDSGLLAADVDSGPVAPAAADDQSTIAVQVESMADDEAIADTEVAAVADASPSPAASPPPTSQRRDTALPDTALPLTLKPPLPGLHVKCDTSDLPTLETALQWAPSPADAARLAKEQQKLVFLIHVSGNFEIPEFT
jgi:hypothetical protein